MDPMRRLVLLLTTLSLFLTTVGCKYTGRCDCAHDDSPGCPPWAYPSVEKVVPVAFPAPPPEVEKPMPKAVDPPVDKKL